MGTRADFYIGRGKEAAWLGSIAWDGYPEGINESLRNARDEATYLTELAAFFADRKDTTRPKDGWPWPWETSHTTDYAYAFDSGQVYAACFGHYWFEADKPEPDRDSESKECEFPDMSDVKNVTLGERSGLMVFSLPSKD